MANEVLKQAFYEMHSYTCIATSVNPDSIIDWLFSKNVISSDDCCKLREVPDSRDRCGQLLSLLHRSSRPQAFIHLRLALLDEYPWVVDEIDKKLPSLESQLPQLHLCHSTDERKCLILPTSSSKNRLHEAIANGHFKEASKLIASQSEAQLVECFEGLDGCSKSCLHLIAAISDTEEATKLYRQLIQKIKNKQNAEYLLNMRTIEKCYTGGRKARVAAIHIAAYSGNSGVVRLLCRENGVDVNCSTSETVEKEPTHGMTPLEWAVRTGNTEVMMTLLDNKADVNAGRHTDGATPLYVSAENGRVEVVKMLLDKKADVNAGRRTDGATPLHVSAENGHVEVVKMLLDKKADVNAGRRIDGATPLYVSAKNGHVEVVKMLLLDKAKVNAGRRTDGATALHAAAENGHVEVLKLLLDKKARKEKLLDEKGKLKKSLDHNAKKLTSSSASAEDEYADYVGDVKKLSENKAELKTLLDNKAKVNAGRSTDGATSLYVSAENGHVEVVKMLLDNKADVNAFRCKDGATPLYVSAENGHVEVVKVLLDNKAKVNAGRRKDGATALYVSAENGHVEVVKVLLDNKAKVNASRREDGATALHAAAENGHVEVVKMLLDSKANINAIKHTKHKTGEKPFDSAERNHHPDVAKLLL